MFELRLDDSFLDQNVYDYILLMKEYMSYFSTKESFFDYH